MFFPYIKKNLSYLVWPWCARKTGFIFPNIVCFVLFLSFPYNIFCSYSFPSFNFFQNSPLLPTQLHIFILRKTKEIETQISYWFSGHNFKTWLAFRKIYNISREALMVKFTKSWNDIFNSSKLTVVASPSQFKIIYYNSTGYCNQYIF